MISMAKGFDKEKVSKKSSKIYTKERTCYWLNNILIWNFIISFIYFLKKIQIKLYFLQLFNIFKILVIILEYFTICMAKGFAKEEVSKKSTEIYTKEKKLGSERMISWSPWPPANFQTKYPAFPLVMTIMLLLIGQWYISLAR